MSEQRLYLQLGFTGSRHGMNDFQKAFFEEFVRDKCGTFNHGDCIGADAEAHDIIRKYRDHWRVVVHPPANEENRAWKLGDLVLSPLPYYGRNKCIVRDSQVLLAFPNGPEPKGKRKGGTWHTINICREVIEAGAPKQCHIILPNGAIGHVQFTPKPGFKHMKVGTA